MTRCRIASIAVGVLVIGCSHGPRQTMSPADSLRSLSSEHRLPTGVRLDPFGRSMGVGNMPPNAAEPATLGDSLVLGHTDAKTRGSRYPAGLALAPNGRTLYVAENLSDSLAVVD